MEDNQVLANLTDAELLREYQVARARSRQLRREIELAEADWLSHPTPENRERIDATRAAWRLADRGHGFEIELSRRMNAPLKSARLALGLSVGEAAKRAGWTRATLKDIESGGHQASFSMCISMWKALGLEIPEGWETVA